MAKKQKTEIDVVQQGNFSFEPYDWKAVNDEARKWKGNRLRAMVEINKRNMDTLSKIETWTALNFNTILQVLPKVIKAVDGLDLNDEFIFENAVWRHEIEKE